MKRYIRAFVLAAFALGPLASAQAVVETYDIDPVHTWVGFSVSHFFTKVPGFFSAVKGTIVVDRDHLENSTAEAVIEVASITTNTRMRDDDLRSTNFFAAAKFPVMTFKSKAWKSTGHRPRFSPIPSTATTRPKCTVSGSGREWSLELSQPSA